MFSTVQNRLESTLSYFRYGSQPSLPTEIPKSLENQVLSAESTLQNRKVVSTPPSIWKRVASLSMSYLVFSSSQSSLQETLSSDIEGYAPNPWALPLTFVAGLSLFPDMVYAQSPKTTFFEVLGGASSDYGNALTITPEGDLVVAGETQSFGAGGSDVLLSKFSSNGTLLWANTLGGASNDQGYAITVTSEGDLVVAGWTLSFGAGNRDVLLSKFSRNGTLLWASTLGGALTDSASALTITSEGDLVVAGRTTSFGAGGADVLLSKFSSNGTLLWASTLGGAGDDDGNALTITPEGDLIVMGITNSFAAGIEDNVLLSKFSSNGTLLWATTFGGTGDDHGYALTVTPVGDLVVAGKNGPLGFDNVLLSKFSSNGTLLWANTLGGGGIDHGSALTVTPEADVIVSGYTYSFGAGSSDVLLFKFSSNGLLLWASTLGGANMDHGDALTATPEGDMIVAGNTLSFGAGASDVLLAKFNAQGRIENCSAWQSIALGVQSFTPTITDVTQNMTTGVPPWTSQDAGSALSVTDITSLLNQTTVCYEQASGNRTFTTSPQTSPSSQIPSELSQGTEGSGSISNSPSMTRSPSSTTRTPTFTSTLSSLASSPERPSSLRSSSKTSSERSQDTGISMSLLSSTFSSSDITNHQTSTMQNSHSQSPTGPLLSNQIVYGVSMEILVGNQVVGTFTFSGGEGTLNSENANTLTIELNEDFYPEDGQEITLFITSDGEWGNVEVISYGTCEEGTGYEANGVFTEEDDGNQRFSLVFEVTSCTSQAAKFLSQQVLSTAVLFG